MWFVVVADGNRGKGGAGTVTVGGWVLPTMADKTMLWILELSGLFLRYLNGSHVTDSRIIQSPINSHFAVIISRPSKSWLSDEIENDKFVKELDIAKYPIFMLRFMRAMRFSRNFGSVKSPWDINIG